MFALRGCYAAWSGKLVAFQDSMLFPASRFKLEPWEMGPIVCPDTWAANYKTTLR